MQGFPLDLHLGGPSLMKKNMKKRKQWKKQLPMALSCFDGLPQPPEAASALQAVENPRACRGSRAAAGETTGERSPCLVSCRLRDKPKKAGVETEGQTSMGASWTDEGMVCP